MAVKSNQKIEEEKISQFQAPEIAPFRRFSGPKICKQLQVQAQEIFNKLGRSRKCTFSNVRTVMQNTMIKNFEFCLPV